MHAQMTTTLTLPILPTPMAAPRAGRVSAPFSAEALACALDSQSLLQGQKTVAISHNGSVYRLQATKLGKLILTK